MKAPSKRRLGETDVEVSEFGFGGAPLGELFVTMRFPHRASVGMSVYSARQPQLMLTGMLVGLCAG